nr:2-succinyl-5-enolpyruvyl-6-hydroxy-3-cyclohexene-1-carboxylic-acid synthase [Opitutaceae bacterium]
MTLDFRNTNALWSSVAAETLFRAGVRHAVISPGSRNTPLTFALVAHPGIATTPVLDERSAAFFGLGIAKRTGAPVVLLCTSGTAGANYLPAVVEARESGAPLLIITADRPPELRDCASGQTIDQQKLFGSFVTFYHELAVPEPRIELLRYLRQTLRHAVARALASGPVHLNSPFRDPLPPIEDTTARPLAASVAWEEFFTLPGSTSGKPAVPAALPADFIRSRGVIVCGGGGYDAGSVATLAARIGWPILADALSPLRLRRPADSGAVIVAAYDAILRDERATSALRPEAVLILGEIPTSKVLRAWLTACDAPTVHLALVSADSSAAVSDPAWTARWQHAEAAAQAALDAGLAAQPAFEGGYVRALASALGRDHTLFVASSMPVRDLEYLAPVRPDGPRVLANRGANGIDGTLSTALGVAHDGAPAVLLTGDLAFLHDTNGLLVAAKLRGSLVAVVVNNAGGGIFGHLPVAAFNPPFEEYWATPQTVDLAALCA